MTDHEHEWIVGLYTAKREDTGQSIPLINKGLHVYCGSCPETLSIPEANAILNEHARLKRENERQTKTMLRLCYEHNTGCWNTINKQIGGADFGGDCDKKPIVRIWRGIPICADCDAVLADTQEKTP